MSEPEWINKISVILLHIETLAEHGGREGLRDEGLLESALARARTLYSYRGVQDISRLAAAYAFGIARNHPFVDGNKRVSFLVIGLFLAKNGYELDAGKADASETMLRLASGDLSEKDLAAWIRKHMIKAEQDEP